MKLNLLTKTFLVGCIFQLGTLSASAQSVKISDVEYYERGNNLYISADIDLNGVKDEKISISLMFYNRYKQSIRTYSSKYSNSSKQLGIFSYAYPKKHYTELDEYTLTIPISELGSDYREGKQMYFNYKISEGNRQLSGYDKMYELSCDDKYFDYDDDDRYDYDDDDRYDYDDDEDEDVVGLVSGMNGSISELMGDDDRYDDDDDDYRNSIGGNNKYNKHNDKKNKYKNEFQTLKRQAERGDVKSQYLVAQCYEEGIGVSENDYQAFVWYKKAAERNYVKAMHKLAECYYDGDGVIRNYGNAARWYVKAAQKGYAKSQYKLGCMYYDGKGVERNRQKAVDWWKTAARNGNKKAKERLDDMYRWSRD